MKWAISLEAIILLTVQQEVAVATDPLQHEPGGEIASCSGMQEFVVAMILPRCNLLCGLQPRSDDYFSNTRRKPCASITSTPKHSSEVTNMGYNCSIPYQYTFLF